MHRIDFMLLRQLVPHYRGAKGERQKINLISLATCLDPILNAWDINTLLRKSHFLGQTSVESWDFCDLVEETSTSYEGRRDLGNTHPGDGARYKGRGLIQVTGRYNYDQESKNLSRYYGQNGCFEPLEHNPNPLCLTENPDLIRDPQALATLPSAISASCAYWQSRNINKYADLNDFRSVTRSINSGSAQSEKRKARTILAQSLMTAPDERELSEAMNATILY